MAQSMAEHLIEKGILQGVQEGREEGIREGREEGIREGRELGRTQAKRDSVLRLLQGRFENLPEAVVIEISAIEDTARLDTIFEQAITAEHLDTLSLVCFERYSQRMS